MSTKTKIQQRGSARVQLPERRQMEGRAKSLDQMVPLDHLARQVVSFADSLDLSELYASIRATRDMSGGRRLILAFCFVCGCTRLWRGKRVGDGSRF